MPALPYLKLADITNQAGADVMSDVPCMVWPTPGRNDSTGRYYDYYGELDYGAWEALQVPNLTLTIDTVPYKLIDAVPHEFLPHVSITLRRVSAGGAP